MNYKMQQGLGHANIKHSQDILFVMTLLITIPCIAVF